MTFVLSLLLQADAGNAKAAIAATAAEAKKLGTATSATGRDAKAAAAGVSSLGAAGGAAAARITTLANAEAAASVTAVKMGQAHQLSAGSVANLTAQFNDIGMMLAAGQNPLQLALQQGTQISQVIGPMGAAGAVKALGAAFIGMLNPVSLITIGSIAAGAALTQWLMEGSEEALTLEEQLESLGDAIAAFDSLTARKTTINDLVADYGAYAEQAQRVLEVERQIAYVDAASALSATAAGLTSMFGELERVNLEGAKTPDWLGEIEQRFGNLNPNSVAAVAEALEITTDEAVLLTEQMLRLQEASGPEAQAIALRDVIEQLEIATGGAYEMEDGTRAVYEQLLSAEKAALRLAGIDLGANMALAATEAGRLAENLGISLQTAAKLAAMGPQGQSNTPGGRADPRQFGGEALDWQTRDATEFLRTWKPTRTAPSGSGRATKDETDAVAALIDKLQQELDILRETDPVQEELLRYRKELAGATEEERSKVEALITARMREAQEIEALQFVSEQAGDALIDGLMGAANAGEQLINVLKRAVLEALILGQGPLAGLFGMSGGIFDGISSLLGGGDLFANIGGFAEGGLIYGPGDGRSDDVLMWGSSGEFMMNAQATARYRHLLEAMNSGSPIPGFALGGLVGAAGTASPRGLMAGEAPQFNLDLRGVQGDREIEERVTKGIKAALAQYDREILPGSVQRIKADPRRHN
jgi:hypothetical protein